MTGTFQSNVGNIIWLSNQSNQKFEPVSGTSNLCSYANNFHLKNPSSCDISTAFTPWQSASTVASSSPPPAKSNNTLATGSSLWNQNTLKYQQGTTMPGMTMPPNGAHFTTSVAAASSVPPCYMSQHDQIRLSAAYTPRPSHNGQTQQYFYPHNVQNPLDATNPNLAMTTTMPRDHSVNPMESSLHNFENISNIKVTSKSSILQAVSSPISKTQPSFQEQSAKDVQPVDVNCSLMLTVASVAPKKMHKTLSDNFSTHNVDNINCKLDNSVNDCAQKCSQIFTEFSDSRKNGPLNLQSADNPLMYPAHFMKGSIIQLVHGQLKRVEDMRTEDFIECTKESANLKIDSSTVIKIVEKENTAALNFSVGEQKFLITVEAAYEHPFYVFGQGWSSCSPARTMQRYGLPCNKLSVGDVCISLTHKPEAVKPFTNNTTGNPLPKHGTSDMLVCDRLVKSKSAPIHDQSKNRNFRKKRRWSAPEEDVSVLLDL